MITTAPILHLNIQNFILTEVLNNMDLNKMVLRDYKLLFSLKPLEKPHFVPCECLPLRYLALPSITPTRTGVNSMTSLMLMGIMMWFMYDLLRGTKRWINEWYQSFFFTTGGFHVDLWSLLLENDNFQYIIFTLSRIALCRTIRHLMWILKRSDLF